MKFIICSEACSDVFPSDLALSCGNAAQGFGLASQFSKWEFVLTPVLSSKLSGLWCQAARFESRRRHCVTRARIFSLVPPSVD